MCHTCLTIRSTAKSRNKTRPRLHRTVDTRGVALPSSRNASSTSSSLRSPEQATWGVVRVHTSISACSDLRMAFSASTRRGCFVCNCASKGSGVEVAGTESPNKRTRTHASSALTSAGRQVAALSCLTCKDRQVLVIDEICRRPCGRATRASPRRT